MIQSHCEQPIEDNKDCNVTEIESEIIFEAAFQNLATKKIQNKKRHDVLCPVHAVPTGVSLLAYRQTSPGNMTQSVIWGINTMMSL